MCEMFAGFGMSEAQFVLGEPLHTNEEATWRDVAAR